MKNRRRMLLDDLKPLIVFKYGNTALTNGRWVDGTLSGTISGGIIQLTSEKYGDTYLADMGAICDVDFTRYRKLKYKVEVPKHFTYTNNFVLALGYSREDLTKWLEIKDWLGANHFNEAGTFIGEFDIASLKGEYQINLIAEGMMGDTLAIMNVYDIWLE